MNNKQSLQLQAESVLGEYLFDIGVRDNEVLENTPRRWLKFLTEFSVALREPYNDYKLFHPKYKLNQMVVVDTKFSSLCEHHLLPYSGKVCLAYLPSTQVIGLSKIIKMITHLSKKPSIQEGLSQEICEEFSKYVPTNRGVAVTIRALHQCVACRYKEGRMLSTVLTKRFRPDDTKYNPATHQEYISYVNMLFKDE